MYTYDQLVKMESEGKAELLHTAIDNSCSLYAVGNERFVVLCDNTVITHQEDNENGPDDAIFPLDKI